MYVLRAERRRSGDTSVRKLLVSAPCPLSPLSPSPSLCHHQIDPSIPLVFIRTSRRHGKKQVYAPQLARPKESPFACGRLSPSRLSYQRRSGAAPDVHVREHAAERPGPKKSSYHNTIVHILTCPDLERLEEYVCDSKTFKTCVKSSYLIISTAVWKFLFLRPQCSFHSVGSKYRDGLERTRDHSFLGGRCLQWRCYSIELRPCRLRCPG